MSFSPVVVRESPVSKTPQRGNLTGNPRKIRDSAADLYNLVQEWNKYHLGGCEILSKVNSLKTSSIKEDGERVNSIKSYPEGLQDLCNTLNETCISLEEVELRMAASAVEVGGVVKLEKLKNSCDTPMFLTWSAHRFEETWKLITAAYKAELDLKIQVKENVAHATTEANLMFYIASWVHQPFIDHNIDILLEALLKETGHK